MSTLWNFVYRFSWMTTQRTFKVQVTWKFDNPSVLNWIMSANSIERQTRINPFVCAPCWIPRFCCIKSLIFPCLSILLICNVFCISNIPRQRWMQRGGWENQEEQQLIFCSLSKTLMRTCPLETSNGKANNYGWY